MIGPEKRQRAHVFVPVTSCSLTVRCFCLVLCPLLLHHALVAPRKVHNTHSKNLAVIGVLAEPHFSLDLRLVLEPD
jgi:hypothetical protein